MCMRQKTLTAQALQPWSVAASGGDEPTQLRTGTVCRDDVIMERPYLQVYPSPDLY